MTTNPYIIYLYLWENLDEKEIFWLDVVAARRPLGIISIAHC